MACEQGKSEHCSKFYHIDETINRIFLLRVPVRRPKDGAKQQSASSAPMSQNRQSTQSENGKQAHMVMFVPSDTNNLLAIPAGC